MLGNTFQQSYFIAGTLAANAVIPVAIPENCTLHHVSASASNNSDATLMLGISTDTDSIMAAAAIGDSGAPVEFDKDNWATTNPTAHLNKGEIFTVTLDYDGAAGTAAANVALVFTFLEG